MSDINERLLIDDNGKVLHWYDFLCPFCYVAQHRNAILVRHGLQVVELPFQAHPGIPPGGIAAGPHNGAIYAMLEREARETGLPLHWPRHLPNTRRALAVAEWVRRHHPRVFPQLHKNGNSGISRNGIIRLAHADVYHTCRLDVDDVVGALSKPRPILCKQKKGTYEQNN